MRVFTYLPIFASIFLWANSSQAQVNVASTQVSFELDNKCSRPGIDCARITYSPKNVSDHLVRIVDMEGELEIPSLGLVFSVGSLTTPGIRPQILALLGNFNSENQQMQELAAESIRGLYDFDTGEPTFFLNPGEVVESRPCCGLAARFGNLSAVEISEVSAGQKALFRFRFLDEYGNRLNPSLGIWDGELSLTLPKNQ